MIQGRYFSIPRAPADYEALWEKAEPLDARLPPAWVGPADPALYRHLGCATWPGEEAPDQYLEEVRLLENSGIIRDHAAERRIDHFFMIDPETAWFNEAVWAIGIYEGVEPYRLSPANGVSNPVMTREQVTDVPAAFVADPFLLRDGDGWLMFFEVMNAATGKGDIGLASSADGISWRYRQIVLTEPFHLSYPYVFARNGEHYMIPETHQAGAVRLYRAVDFPTRWSPVIDLLQGPYFADASIVEHDGRWYLFVDASADLANDTLKLFHADELTGPWLEHPRSPVVDCNAHTARPAGRIIRRDDRLIRFTQDCLPHYGTNVRAFEVRLSATSYEERPLAKGPILGPTASGWNACGMHHVDAREVGGKWMASVDGWFSRTLLKHGFNAENP